MGREEAGFDRQLGEKARKALERINAILNSPAEREKIRTEMYFSLVKDSVLAKWKRRAITAVRFPFLKWKPEAMVGDNLYIVMEREEPQQKPRIFLGQYVLGQTHVTKRNMRNSENLFALLKDPDVIKETGWQPGQEIIIPEVAAVKKGPRRYFVCRVELYETRADYIGLSQIFEVEKFLGEQI